MKLENYHNRIFTNKSKAEPPFVYLSTDSENKYFNDGIVEEIIN